MEDAIHTVPDTYDAYDRILHIEPWQNQNEDRHSPDIYISRS
jgi:hypothetical protein